MALRSLILIFLVFLFQSREAAEPDTGLDLVSVEPWQDNGEAGPAVLSSTATELWRVDAAGLPVVSSAGYVQIRHSGPGFYYAGTLENRRPGAERRRKFDTDNWGDVEAFRALIPLVRRHAAATSSLPRLGLDDISSPFGGFADYDRDGISDHLTHQFGMDINVLLPGKSRPEREVFFGRRNEEDYAADAAQVMAVSLYEAGAYSLTTSSATELLTNPGPFPLALIRETTDSRGARIIQLANGKLLTLLKKPTDHGNHFNARFHPSF